MQPNPNANPDYPARAEPEAPPAAADPATDAQPAAETQPVAAETPVAVDVDSGEPVYQKDMAEPGERPPDAPVGALALFYYSGELTHQVIEALATLYGIDVARRIAHTKIGADSIYAVYLKNIDDSEAILNQWQAIGGAAAQFEGVDIDADPAAELLAALIASINGEEIAEIGIA